jgi:hypothetical protein
MSVLFALSVPYATLNAQLLVSESSRITAASITAESHAQCKRIAPFYWEIGNANGSLVSGSVGSSFNANTTMYIASASKWLYSAYVVEKKNGELNQTDIAQLNFTSGHDQFKRCLPNDTVRSCAANSANSTQSPQSIGKFFYNGGHMQVHAVNTMQRGALANASLAAEIGSVLGLDNALFSYRQPQLAGGAHTNAAVYASFLKRLLKGNFYLSKLLGAHAVCTSPRACGATALSSPFPDNETPLYSLGHWVEDTRFSDGAFTSPGLFGFYPWIDAKKTHYGIVARATATGITSNDPLLQPYTQSMYCGRLIRQAWQSGIAPLPARQ